LIGLSSTSTFGTNFIVNSTGTAAGTVGTFAYAIAQANLTVGPHLITFDNALDGQAVHLGGAFTTALTRANVVIDGTTMSGYSCGNPRVLLSCDAFNGWQWTASGCTIKGLRVRGGLQLNGTGGHKVLSCVFNIDFTGLVLSTAAKGNVRFNTGTSTGNIIGGLSSCEKNVFAGIGGMCIVWDASGGSDQVLGNYMGTDVTGLAILGTGFTVRVMDVQAGNSHLIDGNTLGNVSGSSQGQGINVQGGITHTIRNNNMGALQNRLFVPGFDFRGHCALWFDNAGTSSVVTNNVMGNCTGSGSGAPDGSVVSVSGAGSFNVSLQSNYIGCDINFNNGGSAWVGIYFYASTANAIVNGNYIGHNGIRSAQRSHGITFFNCGGVNNVTNNYIGVTPTGGNMGNGDVGIEVNTGVPTINITGNYIGFNKCQRFALVGDDGGGIRVIDGQIVTISGNYIGTLPGGRLDCGNVRNGIGIEGITATKVDILNNIIAYNDRNAIQSYKLSPDKITISQNCIFCNNLEGIELSGTGIGNSSYGRSFATGDGVKTTVQLSTGFPAWECDFTGATWILRGYGPANDRIEIFQIHHCGCDGTNQTTTVNKVNGTQGLDYIASVTTDGAGRWTYSLPANTVKNGFTVTSTNIAAKRTSEFSPCVSVTPTCLPPLTTTASGSGTGASGAISGTSIAPCATTTFITTGSSTFIRTSCYNNTYYTWLKNGVIIYGPSLTYLDYTQINATDPTHEGNYVLRVEDGNAALPACYLASSAVVVDVVSCGLKLELLSFTGWSMNEFNRLKWSINTDESQLIELQSSNDGKNFTTIFNRFVSQSIEEEFDDHNAASKTFYRLKITPSNGKSSFSKIIVIDKNGAFNIELLNTIVDQTLDLKITSDSDQKINYVIYDIRGITLFESSIYISSGISNAQINLGSLSSAMYLIKFEPTSSGKVETKRFIH